MQRSIAVACAAAILSLVLLQPLDAQIRGSERGVVAQTVDGTTITLDYSRPAARGRELFGELVGWNAVWTPGANWATTLEADRPFRLNGADVPAGRYSVWMIPRQGDWTLFLDRNARLFHFQKPDSSADQIHVSVQPETGVHTEMLTWSFPAVSGDAARLQMQWGTTVVPLQVVVQPSRPLEMAADVRALYTGSFQMTIPEGMGWPTSARLDVIEHDGRLRARLPFPLHPGDELEFDLVPAGSHRFNPGLYRDGRLFNVEMGAAFEFDVADRRAAGVTLRTIDGTPVGQGSRVEGRG